MLWPHSLSVTLTAGATVVLFGSPVPAEVPAAFEVVEWNGTRSQVNALPFSGIDEGYVVFQPPTQWYRGQIAFLCAVQCPDPLPVEPLVKDLVLWKDGQRTFGFVTVTGSPDGADHTLLQNGKPAGSFWDIAYIQFFDASDQGPLDPTALKRKSE